MDADPTTGQSTQVFADIGDYLRAQNLCAPQSLLHDHTKGLLLLEDLGTEDFARHLATYPDEANTLYTAATDVLVALDAAKPPHDLATMTPQVGGDMVAMTAEWYGDPKQMQIVDEVTDHLDRLCPPADTVALRDFHAENLIWRPSLSGSDRVGLLDYQDAFIAPRGYDLVSMLRDVRRRVDPDLAIAMTAHFIVKTNADPLTTPASLACLSVQRNLRILGVFARLALRDDKHKYIQMIPHIWTMVVEDLEHPTLKNLQECVLQTLPPPEKSNIKALL
jgi:aminoglycoside/choline kinase family phosphotransferase